MSGGPQTRRWPSHRVAAVGGLLLLLVVLALLRAFAWPEGAPAAPVDPARWFDMDAAAADRPFRRGLWALAVAGALIVPAVAVAAAATGGRWRPAVVRLARARPWRAGLIAGAGLGAAMEVALLAVGGARFAWGRRHGVIVQPAMEWLADRALAAAITLVLFAALGAGLAVLLARLPRAWPAVLAAALAALAVLLVALTPLLITPLFERTTPLDDASLRADVLALAERAGVEAGQVRVSDASARTVAANARVAGLGDGRRIVLYDTLVDGFPRDQVRTVVAHELAHVARDHIPRGTLWAAVLMAPLCLLLSAAVAWRTGTAPPARDAEGCDLVVRRLAVLAAAGAVLALASLPLQNGLSRAFEREADRLAVTLTADPAAAIALQRGLVESSRNVPDPPGWVVWLFGTHPPAAERVAIALDAGAGAS
ncbi:MAG: M48 family metalloprotease [Miltoncostaeaceae bacterium]